MKGMFLIKIQVYPQNPEKMFHTQVKKYPRPEPNQNKIPRPDPKMFLKMCPDPGPVRETLGFGLPRRSLIQTEYFHFLD